jgi:hypothetical protein
MKKLRILLVLAVAIITSATVQAKKVELKYNLNIGQEIVFSHTLKQELAQEVMGQLQAMENLMVSKYKFKVLEVRADGNFLIEEKVIAMKLVMENDYMNLDYDTESGEDAPAGLEFYNKILNIPFSFLLSPQGEIIEMIGIDKYIETIQESLGAIGDGPEQQLIAGLAAQNTSEEGLRGQTGAIFFKYPKGKTKVGSSWSDESESTQMVKFKNSIENTLVEAGKEKASIKQTVKIDQLPMEGVEVQGMTMNYELSGKKQGGCEVDVKTGLLLKADAVTEISGVISIESPQLASPMSMPMTIKMTETLVQIK